MQRTRTPLFVAFVVALTAACGGGGSDTPTAPSPPPPAQMAGGWSGTLETSNYLPLVAFMDLTQTGTDLRGTWFSTSSGNNIAGNITGTVGPSSFTGTITFSFAQTTGCSGSFSGSAGGNSFSWASAAFTGNCGLNNGNPVAPRFVMQRR